MLALLALLPLAGCGAPATPGGPAPAAPAEVEAEAREDGIEVRWRDRSQGEDGFEVFRQEADDGGPVALAGRVGADETRFLDTAVEPGRAYLYGVATVRGGGSSPPTWQAGEAVRALEPLRSLVVALRGTASGRVVSDPPGIDCPGVCEARFPLSARVALSARPAGGGALLRWGGACGGDGDCEVGMAQDRQVQATFTRYALTVEVTGGTGEPVTVTPPGRSCAERCVFGYAIPVVVGVVVPESVRVGAWGGACAGRDDDLPSCNFEVDGPTEVTVRLR